MPRASSAISPLDGPTTSAPGTTGSKGIAISNWMVSKASGFLARRTSRRGFLVGSAMVGSAVAVAGCTPFVAPGPPYTHITDCGDSFCTDGWTEFCCALTGFNTCPPGTFPAGWWRADYSSFCSGTRYYIDCNQSCCGPQLGNGFCAGCEECRCANGCGTRRVYCNYFRYGQCHTEVPLSQTGPIACRVVTCTPPYVWDPACVNSPAVDNATAEHAPNCSQNLEPAPPVPPKPPPAAVLAQACAAVVPTSGGERLIALRGLDGAIWTRTLSSGTWTPWASLGGIATSGLSLAGASSTDYLAVRGSDNAIWVNRRTTGTWRGGFSLGGASRSDPFTIADGTGVLVFVRGTDDVPYVNRIVNTVASGWQSLGGAITSDPFAVWDGTILRLVARGGDNAVYENHRIGSAWSGWTSLGGVVNSNPVAASVGGVTYVFARLLGNAISMKSFDGTTWSQWSSLGGGASSDPCAIAGPWGVRVLIRGLDTVPYEGHIVSGAWSGWQPLGGVGTSDLNAVSDAASDTVFLRGADQALWYGDLTSAWSGWHSLSGVVGSVNAGL